MNIGFEPEVELHEVPDSLSNGGYARVVELLSEKGYEVEYVRATRKAVLDSAESRPVPDFFPGISPIKAPVRLYVEGDEELAENDMVFVLKRVSIFKEEDLDVLI